MTPDEAIARARAVACAGCDDTEHEMLRGLLAAYDEARESQRAIRRTFERIAEAMGCEPDDDDDLVEAVRENVRERDEAILRAELAKAQLAALREGGR